MSLNSTNNTNYVFSDVTNNQLLKYMHKSMKHRRVGRNQLSIVCEKSEHKPVQLSFFRPVYLEINPIISVNPVNKPGLSTG